MIVKMAESSLKTAFGTYQEFLFYDGQAESIAFVMGEVKGEEDILCRVHSACIYGHYLNSIECDCRQQMEMSQRIIQEAGKGIIIWLDQEGKGNGHYALMKSIPFKKEGMSQAQAYEAAGFQQDARDFTKAAEILQHLGVRSIRMLTNNTGKTETLTKHGIRVSGVHPVVVE